METDKSERSTWRGRCRRPLRIAAALLVVAVIVIAAGYAHWVFVERCFCTITPGAVYRSGAMPPERLVKTVRRYGIKTVIDFRNPGKEATDSTAAVLQERQALTAIGVRHARVPSSQIPSDETVKQFLEVMADPASRPVLMHCYHGAGRAVLFSAIYRIEFEHWDPDRARRAAKLIILPGSTFAADGSKGRFLLAYTPRILSATNAPAGSNRQRVVPLPKDPGN